MTSPRRNPTDAEDIDGEEMRDDDGLLVDEYSSEAFDDPDALDVMDVPRALVDESVLNELPDTGSGLNEVDPHSAILSADDEGDMGLGAEPRSPEELADAAIGRELRGRRGVTRDDELHGDRLLDSVPGEKE
jgi:hypothetical protein